MEECNSDLTKLWDLQDYPNALRDPAFAAILQEDARIFRRRAPVSIRVRYYFRTAVSDPKSLMVVCLWLSIGTYLQIIDFYVTLAGLLGILLLAVLLLQVRKLQSTYTIKASYRNAWLFSNKSEGTLSLTLLDVPYYKPAESTNLDPSLIKRGEVDAKYS